MTTRARSMAALCLATLLACGSDEPNEDPNANQPDASVGQQTACLNTSGERLKARVGRTPDGAKLFLGWHDATRGEDCSFMLATDGKQRCLPPGRPSMNRYADANCAEPLADPSGSRCSGPGPLTYIHDARCDDASGTFTRVHAIRGKVTLTSYWTRESSGACVQKSGASQEYAVGRVAVPPEDFVGLDETLE